MQDLVNQVAAIAALQQNATPGPWVQWKGHDSVFAGPAEENSSFTIKGVRVQIAECRIDPEYDMMSDFDEEQGPYDGKANAAFIAAVGGLDFAALTAALAAQPAPLADGELAALEALEQRATAAPWYAVGQPWGKGNWVNTAEDPHAGCMIADFDTSIARDASHDADDADVDNAHFIAALRNALPGLLARVRAAEADYGQTKEQYKTLATEYQEQTEKREAAEDELGQLRHYVSSLLNDLINHSEVPASMQNALWQHRVILTVIGGQPNV
jgi:hypothetical protein